MSFPSIVEGLPLEGCPRASGRPSPRRCGDRQVAGRSVDAGPLALVGFLLVSPIRCSAATQKVEKSGKNHGFDITVSRDHDGEQARALNEPQEVHEADQDDRPRPVDMVNGGCVKFQHDTACTIAIARNFELAPPAGVAGLGKRGVKRRLRADVTMLIRVDLAKLQARPPRIAPLRQCDAVCGLARVGFELSALGHRVRRAAVGMLSSKFRHDTVTPITLTPNNLW